jgi:hypothetical protein
MATRIGAPRDGVKYPVWAWYVQEIKHKKLDLRRECRENGSSGEKMVCIELVVPESQVVLSDFYDWHMVLNQGLISYTEDADNQQEELFDRLSPQEQTHMLLTRRLNIDNNYLYKQEEIC